MPIPDNRRAAVEAMVWRSVQKSGFVFMFLIPFAKPEVLSRGAGYLGAPAIQGGPSWDSPNYASRTLGWL